MGGLRNKGNRSSLCCFVSLLTPQVNYLFDIIIIKHKNVYFFDCEKKQIDQLYKQLQIYKLRSKVEILNLSNEFVIAAISKKKFLTFENVQEINGFTMKYRDCLLYTSPSPRD